MGLEPIIQRPFEFISQISCPLFEIPSAKNEEGYSNLFFSEHNIYVK